MTNEPDRQRDDLALQLHDSGMTWKQIGDQLGVTGQRAQQLAARAAKRVN